MDLLIRATSKTIKWTVLALTNGPKATSTKVTLKRVRWRGKADLFIQTVENSQVNSKEISLHL